MAVIRRFPDPRSDRGPLGRGVLLLALAAAIGVATPAARAQDTDAARSAEVSTLPEAGEAEPTPATDDEEGDGPPAAGTDGERKVMGLYQELPTDLDPRAPTLRETAPRLEAGTVPPAGPPATDDGRPAADGPAGAAPAPSPAPAGPPGRPGTTTPEPSGSAGPEPAEGPADPAPDAVDTAGRPRPRAAAAPDARRPPPVPPALLPAPDGADAAPPVADQALSTGSTGSGAVRPLDPGLWHLWAVAVAEHLPARGPLGALLTALIGLLATGAGRALSQVAERLVPGGLLPRLLLALRVALGVVVVGAITATVLALVPRALLPLAPVALVALAVAAGWWLGSLLPQILAGVALVLDGRARPGLSVQLSPDDRSSAPHEGPAPASGTVRGTVMAVGLLSTTLLRDDGTVTTVPNRRFLESPVRRSAVPWPVVDVQVTLDEAACTRWPTLAAQRRAVEELVLVLPWRAPGAPIEVRPTAEGGGRLQVRLHVLDPQFVRRAARVLREQVATLDEAPEAVSGTDPSAEPDAAGMPRLPFEEGERG